QTLKPVEEVRPAVADEQLTVDFVGRVDGVPFEGGTASDVKVIVAGPGFIPGFSEQMVGMSAGETGHINVTFPEAYGAKELAGKAAEFEVTVKALAVPETPVVDDEFAKTMGLESAADLRSK